MALQDGTKKKGFFSSILLTVSGQYVMPRSRGKLIRIGLIACAGILGWTLVDALFLGNHVFSPGGLSSQHAMIGSDCARCHASTTGVSDNACSSCHEKVGDPMGVYSFQSHYVYRSEDQGRIAEARREHQSAQSGCASCHPDHRGRNAVLTEVPDARCTNCHRYGSFTSDHPEFSFIRKKIPDDSSLFFTHVRHTDFVVRKLSKERGTTYIEESCLYCHRPAPDGSSFMPLDFDVQCSECHLTTDKKTQSVAVKIPGIPYFPGVETVDMIRQRGGPGTRWAYYSNPNEFVLRGDRISKSPVYHKDPWILENLKSIRTMLYGDNSIADLLQAFGETNVPQTKQRYLEAVERLEQFALELRSRPEPEVQNDLVLINNALRAIRAKINLGLGALDRSALDLGSLSANPNITPAQKRALENLAMDLTSVCRECHAVSRAAIQRVATDQRTLRRAEFGHRAHILDRRCLECHVAIPVTKEMAAVKKVTALMDRAAIQNIPGRENCLECHTSTGASDNCVSCHQFHPNKHNRANLKLFVNR